MRVYAVRVLKRAELIKQAETLRRLPAIVDKATAGKAMSLADTATDAAVNLKAAALESQSWSVAANAADAVNAASRAMWAARWAADETNAAYVAHAANDLALLMPGDKMASLVAECARCADDCRELLTMPNMEGQL
jgi:hypothetical protein